MSVKSKKFVILCGLAIYFLVTAVWLPGQETRPPVRFNTNFPGAAIGKIEYLGNETYRCAIDGQYNQFGRNRQATWFCFRLDDAKDRAMTIRLTNLKGEYNNRPARGDWSKERPVYSYDQVHWTLMEDVTWDAASGEFSFSITPKQETVWIAYTPLYVPSHLEKLLGDVAASPRVRTEVLGKTVHNRDIYELTITDFAVDDTQKRHYWIVARLHAWEALTSWVAEGLVRFLCDTESEQAATICRQAVVHVVVMPDPDGCIRGMVRYNLNGFDTNRNWAAI
ncbi:MAG: M14-type cytosolic carboxypeptidase, partial [Planctomycetia bacterium]|nr:M14-type cytosolic carboxypeptidase [Planctomycetia bacterium]